jgi:hypothetical protein
MNSHSTEIREIRRFGLVAMVFFGALCALGIWKARPLPTYLFGFLCALGLCFLLLPSLSRPIYHGWLKVAHLIGTIITAILLSVVYYTVITPSALIKRVLGGPPLPTKPDKKASTYWVDRSEPAQPKERFLKRY